MAALPRISDDHWQSIIDEFMQQDALRPVIVIIGPTASGKTAFSLEVAAYLLAKSKRAEIINADSRQLYRFLDIGTAKIRPDEMRGVRHHLLSVLDPKESCNIAWFQREATEIIKRLHAASKVPLLVGGSMLYVSAIVDGLQPQQGDPIVRARLIKEYEHDHGATLYAQLREINPNAASKIPIRNKKYLVRALEIALVAGHSVLGKCSRTQCPYDLLILGIERPVNELSVRIHTRTREMFAGGWVDEVKSLMEMGYTVNDPGMQSHGYTEIMHSLQRGSDPLLLIDDIATKGRKYAKRHRTWWRGDRRVRWIDL